MLIKELLTLKEELQHQKGWLATIEGDDWDVAEVYLSKRDAETRKKNLKKDYEDGDARIELVETVDKEAYVVLVLDYKQDVSETMFLCFAPDKEQAKKKAEDLLADEAFYGADNFSDEDIELTEV